MSTLLEDNVGNVRSAAISLELASKRKCGERTSWAINPDFSVLR
jgi:hypothetical protein